ncbi:uncharacterized protein [Argopecten irradians]|uniref:uncharacterized protein n=1 Tax=Argopecten irradians TaxID=31199 RepID=UPI003715639E
MTDMPLFRDLRMNHCDLTILEAGIFGDLQLTYVVMNCNCFKFTHENPFTNLNQLQYLDLGHNEIDYIPETAFQNCTSLTSLRLHENNIGWLSKEMFKDSPLTSQFYAYDNEISCIEDGTFNHTNQISHFFLHNNKLEKLPTGGDFSSKTMYDLYLYNNRFTELPSGVFEDLNVAHSMLIYGSSITAVRSGAFRNSRFGNVLDLRGNPLNTIETGAFESSTFDTMYLNDMQISHLPTGAFRSVTATYLYLHSNDITHIERAAFQDVHLDVGLYLHDNKLTNLTDPLFSNASSIGGLFDLGHNNISIVASKAFDGLTSVSSLVLNDNSMEYYPTAALANLGLEHINISNNNIRELSLVAFRHQDDLITVNLTGNSITKIRKGTLANLFNLQTLLLGYNLISYIEPGSFSGLGSIETIDVSYNNMFFFPAMPNLTSLARIDLSHNQLMTFESAAFDEMELNEAFNVLDLTGNQNIGCDCYMIESLKKIRQVISGGLCGSPLGAINTSLDYSSNRRGRDPAYFVYADPRLFLCSPVDVIASTVTSADVTVTWARPESITIVSDTDDDAWRYNLTCTGSNGHVLHAIISSVIDSSNANSSSLANSSGNSFGLNTTNASNSTGLNTTPVNTTTVNSTNTTNNDTSGLFSHTFTIDDGVMANTEYICVVAVLDGNANFISSPPSQPGVVRTQRDKTVLPTINITSASNSTNSTNTTNMITTNDIYDWTLPIVYYDFSDTHPDFVGYETAITSRPTYVPSPFEAWLSRSTNPSTDSFSSWFVDNPATNIAVESTIKLEIIGTVPPTHRYESDSFFPVDGVGYGDNQKDCFGADHNFGFTSAIRVAFGYQGIENETITVGGGDDLWVYINDILVVEVINRGNDFPCKMINLYLASAEGGSTIIPQAGVIVSGQCVITNSEPTESVFLDLSVGEKYRISIFHAERLTCSSNLYIQTENINFITDPLVDMPSDYVITPPEDFHVNGTLKHLYLVDIFSSGPPFNVTVIRGGSTIIPQAGVIVSGQCVITNSEPTESVFLDLSVGEKYRISIFHAERLTCSSNLYIQTENINFITDPLVDMPSDYVITPPEDFHVNGTLKHLYLADIFSSGPPFNVTVIRGNEGRHFTILDNTAANVQAAVPPNVTTPNYNTVDGISYVECINTSFTGPDEENNDTTVETFTVNTGSVLFTLVSSLDYEVRSSYTVVMEVVDIGKVPPTTGTITVKVNVQDVNDNCPVLNETNFDLIADPALQSLSIATLLASDSDGSTNNSDITYYISTVLESPALDFNPSLDLFRDVYVHTTILNFSVIAVDSGSPPRGSRATMTLEVDNSCLIDATYGPVNYSLSLNSTTGELYFRAPGYYVYHLGTSLLSYLF